MNTEHATICFEVQNGFKPNGCATILYIGLFELQFTISTD